MRKEKKVVSILLIVSILLSVFMPIIVNAESFDDCGIGFYLSSDTTTELNAGDTVTVSLNVELATGVSLDTVIGAMYYNPNILKLKEDEEESTPDDPVYCIEGNGTTKFYSILVNTFPTGSSDSEGLVFNLSRSASTSKQGKMIDMQFEVLQDAAYTDIILDHDIDTSFEGSADIYCDGSTLRLGAPATVTTNQITYDANTTDEVTGLPSAATKDADVDYTIEAGPTRTNYNFVGWNTAADGTGTSYAAGDTYSVNADLDLYAQWELKTVTLTVDPNGGVWEDSLSSQSFTQGIGTTKEIVAPTSAPAGYIVRFNASSNGGTTDTLQTIQTNTFSNWTLEGSGELTDSTYTFGNDAGTLTANYTGDSIVLPEATKEGYVCNGWYTDQVGGTKVGDVGDDYTPTADITIFAQFTEAEYTLTIDPNGGTWNDSSDVQTVDGLYNSTTNVPNPVAPNGYTVTLNNEGTTSTVVQTKSFEKWTVLSDGSDFTGTTYTYGAADETLTAVYTENNVELPTPEKTGYTFDGWYDDETAGTKVESPYMPTADITLYARFIVDDYEVTFNPDGGTVTPTSKNVTYGQAYGELPTPIKDGYDFEGWYNEDSELVTDTSIMNYANDSVLTAHWSGAEYTLTVDPNGGTWNDSSDVQSVSGTYNSTTNVPNPVAPNGYTVTLNNEGTTSTVVQTKSFEKWTVLSDGSDFTGTSYTFGAADETLTAVYTENNVELPTPEKTGYTFDGWYDDETAGTKVESPYMPTADITLYARFVANEYEVTFNPDEGTVTPTSKNVTYGEAYGELPTPTKDGYDFDGWYNEDSELVTDTSVMNYANDSVLTAHWVAAEYEVTFDPDEGTVEPTSKNVTYGETYGELPTPTKDGYTFDGWFDDEDNKIESTTVVTKTADHTLTAKWTIIQTTLTVNPNGGKWEDSTETQTFTEDYNTTKEIADPTEVPAGKVVTFDAGAGTCTVTDSTQVVTFEKWTLSDDSDFVGPTYTFGLNNETLTAQYSAGDITLPSALKVGAIFKGWYTLAEGGVRVGGAGDAYTPTEDVTLYAQYNDIIYTLTIDPNGGTWNESSDVQDVDGTYNTTIDVPNAVGPNGYTVTLNNDGVESTVVQTKSFEKWTVLSDGSDFTETTYTYGLDDETLTAVYTENNVELPTPEKTGYTFDGWYDDETAGTKVESPYMPTADITLYARFIANEYEVTFNAGAGTVEPTSKNVTYGEAYGELPTPVRDGYDFDGWYNEDSELVTDTSIMNYAKDSVLTAHWLGAEYTVTFDPDGGEVSPTSKTVRNEGTYGELPTPEKTGYTFDGWFDDEDNKIESTTVVNLSDDQTLTAKWTAVQTTLTVDPNGGEWEESTDSQTFTENYNTTKEIANPTVAPNGFVVTFDANGGTATETEITQTKTFEKWILLDGSDFVGTTYTFGINDETLTAQYQGDNITLPEASQAGKTFIGWYDDETEGTKVGEAGDAFNPTADVTLYAHFENIEYTITYNNLKDSDNSLNPATYTIDDATIELNNLANIEGEFVFDGWYSSEDEDAEKITSIDCTKMENIVLYARWTEADLYLSSEKYKIGENDIDNYEAGDIYLDKIEPETTVAELKANCETNGIMSVIDSEGNVLGDDDLVGTNMTIKVTKNDKEITLTAVVMGDLDGNGIVTATDYSAINQAILELVTLDGAYYKAADLDDNEDLTATDLSTINNTILGKITLTYTKNIDA